MFDSHRQVFTTVHGETWLLTIVNSACRVNVTFMVLFMRGCHIHRWRISILKKLRFSCTYWAAVISCVLALSVQCSTVSSASGRS